MATVKKKANPPIPTPVTVRWLLDHVPISWWVGLLTSLFAIVTTAFSAGLTIGKIAGHLPKTPPPAPLIAPVVAPAAQETTLDELGSAGAAIEVESPSCG